MLTWKAKILISKEEEFKTITIEIKDYSFFQAKRQIIDVYKPIKILEIQQVI